MDTNNLHLINLDIAKTEKTRIQLDMPHPYISQDNIGDTMTRLWAGWSEVQIPARPRDFPLLQSVQTNSGNSPASYSEGTSSSFSTVQWP